MGRAVILEKVLEPLPEEKIAYKIFDQVKAEFSIENLLAASHRAKLFPPDLFYGLGRGSPMDSAKIASIFMLQEAQIRDLLGVEKVTATSGIDAFIQDVESYMAIEASPLPNPLAWEAIHLIFKKFRIRSGQWSGFTGALPYVFRKFNGWDYLK